MVAFNTENLEKIIERYIADFESVRAGEIYKWEALYCFKQHWNPDAADFAAMLDGALSKEVNLLTSVMYFPKGMLLKFAEMRPDDVRSLILDLFDESRPLRIRLEAFHEGAAGLLAFYNKQRTETGEKDAKNHYQDPHAMSVYLAFANTDSNYIYKPSIYRDFSRALELEAPGNRFDKVIAYSELCDSVLAYIEEHHPELIEMSDASLAPEYVDADPKHHMLISDLVYYFSGYLNGKLETVTRAWIYAPGENACAWDDCLNQEIMVLGWDEIGDFAQYETREEMAEKLREVYEEDGSKTNVSLACWQFQHDVRPGDVIYAKRGLYSIIGKGIVRSGARYDYDRDRYVHVRDVEWVKTGDWDVRGARIPAAEGGYMKSMPMKTLTDWTSYPDAIKAMELLISGELPIGPANEPPADDPAYWFLVANPKIWSFADIEVGQEQFYTLFNDNGNPRRIQKNFLAAKPGDIIVGYESQPVKRVVAICEVAREHDDEKMYIRKVGDVRNPVTFEQIKNDPVLSGMEFMRNFSGSLFILTDEEFGVLEELMEPESSPIESKSEPYTDADFYNEVFIEEGALGELRELLERKKNIILQGAPGTGKTFAAKRLAWAIMGCKDNTRVQLVQFHQNTTYDDFVYGYRPTEDGGFETRPGVFTEFCDRAAARPDEKFFFIIDEINRANISKVFGELLMLIEADHRDESLVLPVSGDRFSMPGNVYIIGMMNTADRSLALIDYALRRRFAFYEVEPAFDNERFRQTAGQAGERMLKLVDAVKELNKTIEADALLGRGFRIGYSYFCPAKGGAAPTPESVVEYELKHLIEEYWFDSEDKAKDALEKLRGAIS